MTESNNGSGSNSAPKEESVPSLSLWNWILAGAFGAALGFGCQYIMGVSAYRSAQEQMLAAQPAFAARWPADVSAKDAAAAILRRFSVDQNFEALNQTLGNHYASTHGRALELAVWILNPGGCEKPANAEPGGVGPSLTTGDCAQIKAEAPGMLADLLLGSADRPAFDLCKLGELKADHFTDDCQSRVETGTADDSSWYGLLRHTPSAWSPEKIGSTLYGLSTCEPGPQGAANENAAKCRLFRGLLAGALESDDVRDVRANRVNFWKGYERALVLSLAGCVAVLLAILSFKRQSLTEQAKFLRERLAQDDNTLSPYHPGARVEPEKLIQTLQQDLYTQKGGADSAALQLQWKKGLTALRDLVNATRESLDLSHRTHLEQRSRLYVAAIERQRALISALITAFPALGLYATLQGLITALSNASGIVAGTEPERVAATEFVTSTLGACFATTLIALLCMAVFAVINVRGGHKEIDIIEGIQQRLLAVYWPGRSAATGASTVDSPSRSTPARAR